MQEHNPSRRSFLRMAGSALMGAAFIGGGPGFASAMMSNAGMGGRMGMYGGVCGCRGQVHNLHKTPKIRQV